MAIFLKKGDRGAEVKLLQKYLHLYEDGIFGQITEAAVKEFQRKNGLKVDGIVGMATWAKIVPFMLKKSKRVIKEIIVHCAATPEGKAFTVEDVRRWHKQQGWTDIGYHYVIHLDGAIYNGRDVDKIGAHCSAGGHNTYSIGVCYIGGCAKDGKTPKDTRTWEQKESLKYILKELKKLYPGVKIYGHHDFDKGKACPSFDAQTEYKSII